MASPYRRRVISFQRWGYEYFSLPGGVQVSWATHRSSCLHHATVDGKVALCGAANLTDEGFGATVFDPAADTMACENCLGRVRRVSRRATRP